MEPAEYQPFPPEVHDFVDGRLSAEAEHDFQRKLGQDAALRRQVEDLRRAITLLRELPLREPRAGFDTRVIGRIREEDLAERARRHITARPMPLWQHVVQVGLGAAAAALVFAFVGIPGLFESEPDPLEGEGGMSSIARVEPTESDLLPALADHNARFDSLRRNLSTTRLSDPNLQRQVVAMELQYSDLLRRNAWLSTQVAELPPRERARYEEFLVALDRALTAINDEVNESHKESRVLNIGLVDAELSRVKMPGGELEGYRISATPESRGPALEPVEDSQQGEVALYFAVREADYRHDHAGVILAVDAYLARFSQGRFRDSAIATAVGAQLRLGLDLQAARRFNEGFKAEYDEDLQPGQLELVRGLLTVREFERLSAARKALRE